MISVDAVGATYDDDNTQDTRAVVKMEEFLEGKLGTLLADTSARPKRGTSSYPSPTPPPPPCTPL